MSNDLDTRARTASTAVHAAVRDVTLDRIPGRSLRPRGRMILAVAAAVVAVALGAALLRDGKDDTRVATDGDGDVPRLLLGEVPDGLSVTGAADLPLPGPASEGWVYGDPSAAEPFAEGDLAVVQPDGDLAGFTPGGDPAGQIDGHRTRWAEREGSDGGGSLGIEVGDGWVALSSWTLDQDAIEAAARELDLDDLSSSPESLGGLELVGEGQMGLTPPLLMIGAERGHLIGYQDGGDGAQTIVIATLSGDDEAVALLRWSLGPDLESVTVDGHPGWSGAPNRAESAALVWQQSEGVIVTMTGTAVTVDDLIAAADSLREATDEEWEALLDETDSLVPSDALAGVSAGDVDGDTYAVYLDQDGSLCLASQTEGESGASCAGPTGEPVTAAAVRLGSGRVVVGVYTTLGTPGMVNLDVGGAGSATTDDGTLLAVALDESEVPALVRVLDADGTVLGSTSISVPPEGAMSFTGRGTEISSTEG